MSKVAGRRDDMLVIRGVNVYPSEVESVLVARPELAPHYLLVVDQRQALPRLVVACEPAAGAAEPDEGLGADIEHALFERLGLHCEAVVLPRGTVPRTEVGKAVRVARRTPDHDPLEGWL
jgi:phenylacetate-CoA ligase